MNGRTPVDVFFRCQPRARKPKWEKSCLDYSRPERQVSGEYPICTIYCSFITVYTSSIQYKAACCYGAHLLLAAPSSRPSGRESWRSNLPYSASTQVWTATYNYVRDSAAPHLSIHADTRPPCPLASQQRFLSHPLHPHFPRRPPQHAPLPPQVGATQARVLCTLHVSEISPISPQRSHCTSSQTMCHPRRSPHLRESSEPIRQAPLQSTLSQSPNLEAYSIVPSSLSSLPPKYCKCATCLYRILYPEYWFTG